ncbi:MAG: dimethyl sulfoxide reductase anchor subunit family protein [Candidatus Puniceispirillaceae bacterium]|jgi:DMSO reductase anchor subunit
MRPAWSIIFFTTISGLGLGLAGWIVLGLLPLMTPASVMGVGIATLALIGVGLVSSTFHLGHPERAWRALSQWRSSWLSREGVLAVIVMAGLAGWFAAAHGGWHVPLWANLVLLVLIYVTVYATSMIYASLKTVARWHHPLTPVCYLMFAAAGGLLATLALLAILRLPITAALAQAAIVLMLSAWGVKLAWWRVAGMAPQAGSIESATGLGSLGAVRPLMPPHTEENYLQHEMGFVVGRKHADKLRMIALLLGGGLPVLILVLAPASAGALAVAVLAHVAGMFVERWLFFAEAKHVVTLYYGEAA